MDTFTISNISLRRLLLGLALTAILGACATSSEPTPTTVAQPIQVLPFDEAVLKAANDLFAKAQLPATNSDPAVKHVVVIDPLIDGITGFQSTATQSMQAKIEQLASEKYPRFQMLPFSKASVTATPIVLVGTFTPINQEGKTEGTREAYRICLALADLKSGKIIGKGTARALMQGVDATPTRYFQDSPTWMPDPATEGYIKTCQGTKIGDPINPVYLERIQAAALIGEATMAYDAGQYQRALELYQAALQIPEGDQLRAYNGTYLTHWKLGQRAAATQSFGKIVDYGLANQRLAVKFLFKPGSTAFLPNAQITGPYPLWIGQIAARTAQGSACLEISGHTSPTGSEPRNEQLSLQRAELIKQRLTTQAPQLRQRTKATGKGSKVNLVGTGKDDVTDALDRRVVFQVTSCPI
jgi:outer membrane protein OmpA-like peptidoglycan-associated protein